MTSRHTRLFKGLVGDSDEHVAREYSNSSSTTAGADGDDDDGGDFKEFWGIVQEVVTTPPPNHFVVRSLENTDGGTLDTPLEGGSAHPIGVHSGFGSKLPRLC